MSDGAQFAPGSRPAGQNTIAAMAAEEQKKLVKRWLEDDPPLIPVVSELPAVLYSLMLRRPNSPAVISITPSCFR